MWQGSRGRISRAQLEAVVDRPDDTLCFVCGPEALVHEVPRMLGEIGVGPTAFASRSGPRRATATR